MKRMSSAEARQAFLDYFEEMQHKQVASSSLVPANDPTLLFANSGMVQFKDVFLGSDKRDYVRATTSQKCMRVSGKHNDLEEVGPSPRHHTFFEMLGNFSFGDYFKRDAIRYAYELLTKVYELPPDRLAFTVYENDDEAYGYWVDDVGVDPRRVARMGPDTNFWQMADTGPCGPTSEIHWDHKPEMGEDSIIPMLQAEDERFLELWNLVFMQFNRTQVDKAHSGQFDKPLPAPGVDTGLGLERILSVIQEAESNYETDLFMRIIEATQELTGHSDAERDANYVPYRVIADHARAAVFLIADNVPPGAKGRNSVTRTVIRRAVRFGKKLGFERPFLAQVADAVIDLMGGHYIELVEQAERIKSVITKEEERFYRTLDRGLGELEAELDDLAGRGETELSGKSAFYLHATLGMPIQVTKDIAEERGLTVDIAGFEAEEARHIEVSQAVYPASIASGEAFGHPRVQLNARYNEMLQGLKNGGLLSDDGVDYNPYDLAAIDSKVVALIQNGQRVESAISGDRVEIVLSATPFYVEAGGQVSDTGTISGDGWLVEVEDVRQPVHGLVVHVGEVIEGTPKEGDEARAAIDAVRRWDIRRNHTATHLLHAALRNTLGSHVEQRGSLVAPDRLRFDFSHDDRLTAAEAAAIEDEINAHILANFAVQVEEKTLDEARSEGAMALFGEKYGDRVRTIGIVGNGGRYSLELCGGTHVDETSEIGPFVWLSEGSISAGIRRIEALTGRGALDYMRHNRETLARVANHLGATQESLDERVVALQDELNAAKRQVSQLQRALARQNFSQLIEKLDEANGVPTLVAQLDDVPMDTLREMSDWFRDRVTSGVMVLGSIVDERPQLIVAVTDDLTKQGLHAGNIVKRLAPIVGGGGGGRPTMAQAGGKDSARLPDALKTAREVIAEQHG